jgi:uncharacterized protein (TIGR00369 family)
LSVPEAATTPSPEAVLARGRDILAAQPISAFLGVELRALTTERAEMHLPLRPEMFQHHGFAHGGVVSFMADSALTFAGGAAMRAPVVTAEFKINYVRPAVGERLIARAKAVHAGKAQAVCACEVFVVRGGEEKLCALAQGTIARLPPAPGQPGA